MNARLRLTIVLSTTLLMILLTAAPAAHAGKGQVPGEDRNGAVPQAAADYDRNSNGVIDRNEAVQAIRDYLDGLIPREDAVTVLT